MPKLCLCDWTIIKLTLCQIQIKSNLMVIFNQTILGIVHFLRLWMDQIYLLISSIWWYWLNVKCKNINTNSFVITISNIEKNSGLNCVKNCLSIAGTFFIGFCAGSENLLLVITLTTCCYRRKEKIIIP